MSSLNELSEHWLNQDLLFRSAESNYNVVVDVQTQGMEAQEQRHPAQVGDNRFFVLQHAIKHVAFICFRVVVPHQEDCSVGKSTDHDESSNVLVVRVQRSLSREVLSHECVGRHGVHVLCHQGGDYPKSSEVKCQLEVQRVVVGVVQALVRQVELPFTLAADQTGLGVQHFFDAVTNTEVSPVHMTGNDERYCDRQVVVSDVCQPQGFCLGMEATQESQNRGSRAFRSAEDMAGCIWVLAYTPQLPLKKGAKPAG